MRVDWENGGEKEGGISSKTGPAKVFLRKKLAGPGGRKQGGKNHENLIRTTGEQVKSGWEKEHAALKSMEQVWAQAGKRDCFLKPRQKFEKI